AFPISPPRARRRARDTVIYGRPTARADPAYDRIAGRLRPPWVALRDQNIDLERAAQRGQIPPTIALLADCGRHGLPCETRTSTWSTPYWAGMCHRRSHRWQVAGGQRLREVPDQRCAAYYSLHRVVEMRWRWGRLRLRL